MSTSLLATILQVLGLVLLTIGGFTISATVGLIIAGLGALLVGLALERGLGR